MRRGRVGQRGYWVPQYAYQLRGVLREMGVDRINGVPLSRVRKAQLYAVYFQLRDTHYEQQSVRVVKTDRQ